MSLYKPTELLEFLESIGAKPKKGLSQNFLIDGNIVRKIVEIAQVAPGDWVVEIGPGPGSLTECLLAAGANVIAIEKDLVLAVALERLQTPDNRLNVISGDAMDVDLDSLPMSGNKAKIIANLPYHLTTPLIAKYAERDDLFSSLTVMIQHEVALRVTAEKNTSEYSSFTIFLQAYGKASYAFKVTRQCFFPVPGVDSAVLHLELHRNLPAYLESIFFRLTRVSFGKRRKMLRASLKEEFPNIEQILLSVGISPEARPETLSFEDFKRVAEAIYNL